MIQKMLVCIVSLLVLNLSVASISAQANDEKVAKHVERVKAKVTKLGLGRKARIDVKTFDGTEVVGWVSQRSVDDFVVTDDFGDAKTIAFKDVKGFVGRDLSTGQKISIGVGIGFGLALLLIWAGLHGD